MPGDYHVRDETQADFGRKGACNSFHPQLLLFFRVFPHP